jgi:hypothetical protein
MSVSTVVPAVAVDATNNASAMPVSVVPRRVAPKTQRYMVDVLPFLDSALDFL